MIRRIIIIDQDKCNGCRACVDACHEGAIGMRDGKAVLLRDDYCDGLGDCLPACPTGAISFEEREALPYDEAAVLENMRQQREAPLPCGCPGTMARQLEQMAPIQPKVEGTATATEQSYLRQWPVQLKLVPVTAPYLQGADLLIAADCTAYARASFHQEFMAGKVTLIGCPKLDAVNYAEKLAAIFRANDIRSVTVTRMSVPCCQGMASAVARAIELSGKNIPLHVTLITPEGNIADLPQ